MELPIYWGNCCSDPRSQVFNDQFSLAGRTLDLLQRFVHSCTKEHATIVSARRIENSVSWNRYIDIKALLRKDMELSRQNIDTLDDVTTSEYLRQQEAEDAFSTENLDESINEFFLWHGTSLASAETIAADFFEVTTGDARKVSHGIRFGVGAYFAEDLDKSLSYTKSRDALVRHVLLCRVCCGGIYHTDSLVDPAAHQKARANGKTCVLANPLGRGHREFVVLSETQVYPEYIIELNAKFSL
jgi:hypothetical protein